MKELVPFYRRRDADGLRALAREALALADVIDGVSAGDLGGVAPDPRAERARKAAAARWSKHTPSMPQACPEHTPSMPQACPEHVGGDKGGASLSSLSDPIGDSSDQKGLTKQDPFSPVRASVPGGEHAPSIASVEHAGDASSMPAPPPRRDAFAESFNGAVEAFVAAVAASNGGKHRGLQWRDRDELSRVVAAHGPSDPSEIAAWVTRTVGEYLAAQPDATYWARTPKRLGAWLDDGRPVAKRAPAVRAVQGGPRAGPANTTILDFSDDAEDVTSA